MAVPFYHIERLDGVTT